jgi:probable H4MPT-linked C1 transfer pathway protein
MVAQIIIGWDIGGAHLKAAMLENHRLVRISQSACPLWQDLSYLHKALDAVLQEWPRAARHVITMTGELADLFPDRATGVKSLLAVMRERLPDATIAVFAGHTGIVDITQSEKYIGEIASANWLATACYTAGIYRQGVLIDIGSTTTDIIPFQQGQVLSTSITDADRLQCDELVYTGVVRTPVCAKTNRVPWKGQWHPLMAEVFATSADVYRILVMLPQHADQLPSADGRGKSVAESTARLARMVGCDTADGSAAEWQQLATHIARRQLETIQDAIDRILSKHPLADDAPLIGAGVGRFLVRRLAELLGRPYIDFAAVCRCSGELADKASDCAPAVALALSADVTHGETLDR